MKEFLPDPAEFDLIVIGGGNADPRKRHAWILRVHEFIRQTRKEWPRKKMVGVCWGHQTLGMVLGGGEVGEMGRPEVCVFLLCLLSCGWEPMMGEYICADMVNGGEINSLV